MAKKLGLIGIILLIVAAVLFINNRRSHMMGAGSQGSAGGLKAVTAQGAPIPPLAAQTATGQLPENTAQQESGGLLVSLSINPYPPSSGNTTDFIVNLSDTNGQPVSDATISLDLTMPEMWMPPNQLNLVAGQPGNYQGSGYFTMRGLWLLEVIITQGSQKQSVFFDVGL